MLIKWNLTPEGRAIGWPIEDIVGFVSLMLNDEDPRSAVQQLNDGYQHGGGWSPFEGFTFSPDDHGLSYPGDPTLFPLAYAQLRNERIYVYPHAWFAVVQPNGDYEVCRMD